MDYIEPKRLLPGKSIIGLIAPSGVVEKHGLEAGIKLLDSWGFSVKLGRHIIARRGDYSAGTDLERAKDFLDMVASEEISAVGCIIGGFAANGLLRVLEPRVFKYLEEYPKILFGYSDFSLILNALFSRGFISLHAPNLSGLYRRSLTSQKSLKLSLLGELPAEIGPLADWEPIKPGFAKGRFLVSNLESLVSLMGTPLDPLNRGDDDLILGLEEVGENKSTIFRWLERLAMHSRAKRIKGIVVGRFTRISERDYPIWGREMSVERIFLKVFGVKDLPIASLPQFGHIEEKRGIFKSVKSQGREKVDFLSLANGPKVLFKVKAESCRLVFLEKGIV
jgi:muramoyltetrapeptide carboxypeptidase